MLVLAPEEGQVSSMGPMSRGPSTVLSTFLLSQSVNFIFDSKMVVLSWCVTQSHLNSSMPPKSFWFQKSFFGSKNVVYSANFSFIFGFLINFFGHKLQVLVDVCSAHLKVVGHSRYILHQLDSSSLGATSCLTTQLKNDMRQFQQSRTQNQFFKPTVIFYNILRRYTIINVNSWKQ